MEVEAKKWRVTFPEIYKFFSGKICVCGFILLYAEEGEYVLGLENALDRFWTYYWLYRHLNVSQIVNAMTSSLKISSNWTRTRNPWFPLESGSQPCYTPLVRHIFLWKRKKIVFVITRKKMIELIKDLIQWKNVTFSY